MARKGDRARRLPGGGEITVSVRGRGQDSTVLVSGLPPLTQADARWLLDALAHVVLMPPGYADRVRATRRG